VIRSGASVLLMDVQAGDQVLKDILADSGTSLVFSTSRHAKRLKEIAPDITLAILDAEDDKDGSWKKFLPWKGICRIRLQKMKLPCSTRPEPPDRPKAFLSAMAI